MLADDGVLRIVKHPGVIATRALAPAREPCVNPFGSRRIGKFDEPRQPPRSAHSSASVPRSAWSRSASSRTDRSAGPSDNASQPLTSETPRSSGVGGSCSGLKPVGAPFFSGRYFRPRRAPGSQGRDPYRTPPGSRPGARASTTQKADEHGLARSRRTAYERVAGVLAAAAVRILRVGRMQREVVRRA